MRMSIALLVAIALAPAMTPLAAETPAAPESIAPGAVERIQAIAQGVWVIRQREPFHAQPVGNVTIVEQARGLVLIDGGGSPGSARRVAALIRSVSRKPVRAIAITHWHGDHSLGVATLLEQWPRARVIATSPTRGHLLGESMERYPKGAPDEAKVAAFLQDLGPVVASFDDASRNPSLPANVRAQFASTVKDLALYRADIRGAYLPLRIEGFDRSLTLADTQRPVELRFLGPGNTDGDLIAWLPRQRIVATGDLVVAPIPFGFGSYPRSGCAISIS